jgi:hypothetical protein
MAPKPRRRLTARSDHWDRFFLDFVAVQQNSAADAF